MNNQNNELQLSDENQRSFDSVMSNSQSNRQIAEVQGAIVIAKKFPRDEIQAIEKIKNACKRVGLAEDATYSYPRGGQRVEGPSIRLAETLARYWGNIDYGTVALERGEKSTLMMAYCWDLETNVRSTKVFKVDHIREKKSGNVELTDPRDIYEIGANMGARRMRNCIMAIIPGDVQDLAVAQCNKTLEGKSSEPLRERVTKMVKGYDELGVTTAMIETKIGYNVSAINEKTFVELCKIFNSIKDGVGKIEDFFPTPNQPTEGRKPVDIDKGKSDEELAKGTVFENA